MLHEVLALLSGHPGSLFVTNNGNSIVQVQKNLEFLHPAEEALLERLYSLGSQFKTIRDFAEDHLFNDKTIGVIYGIYARAFAHGINEVLKPYQMEICNLEMEIISDSQLSVTHFLQLEKFAPLFQCLLDVINLMKKEKTHGCRILEVLHTAANCGIPVVEICMQRILRNCHRIFLRQIRHWMLVGELCDSFQEFFICPAPDDDQMEKDSNKSKKLKYVLEPSLIPSYIPTQIAEKILFVGQFLDIIDHRNQRSYFDVDKPSSAFINKRDEYTTKLLDLGSCDRFSVFHFCSIVTDIRTCAAEHMWKAIVEESDFFSHLRNIRDFYLLGNGDLYMAFIEVANDFMKLPVIGSTLRDAHEAFRSAVMSACTDGDNILENFLLILQENRDDPHGIKLTSLSKAKLETGWSAIGLVYEVPQVLDTIFTPSIMERYNNVFRFLLSVRRVQVELNQCFIIQKADKDWRRKTSVSLFWQLRSHMAFFIDNLQYYLQVDVLESQFADLLHKVESIKDFEAIQHAHEQFLISITSQCFLNLKSVYYCLLDTLDLCSSFCVLLTKVQNSPGSKELAHYSNFRLNFQRQTSLLFRVLSGIRNHQVSPHLAQLMLRMDFNSYVTSTGSHLGGPEMQISKDPKAAI